MNNSRAFDNMMKRRVKRTSAPIMQDLPSHDP